MNYGPNQVKLLLAAPPRFVQLVQFMFWMSSLKYISSYHHLFEYRPYFRGARPYD